MAQPDNPPNRATERLDSWKEIAAYLKRSVRTVQDWEKKEGLPVHRHLHDKLGTVYAYRAEIDAWWNNRRPRLEQQEQAAPKGLRNWLLLAVASALAITVVGIGVWRMQRPPALVFAERDWVLIAAFENRTGEAAFDGVLEFALERELSNSRFVNVVPRQRVEDALRLMKRPLDTQVSAAVGREICLRDASVRALVGGRVEKLDSTYLLAATLVEPSTGRTVASFSEEAEDQKNVFPAIRRLSSRLRERLGEELSQIRKAELQLEKATTPSVTALKEYSRALGVAWQGNWAQAAEILERALREDPEFASAHSFLARCYVRMGKKEQAALHHQRAWDLAGGTSDRERYFIQAGYYEERSNESEKAARTYELLLKEFPGDLWGMHSLQWLYERLGQTQKNVVLQVRFADVRPNDAGANLGAARALAIWANNRPQAEPYLRRARTLISTRATHPANAGMSAYLWLELLPVYELWSRGEPERALRELDQVAERLSRIPEARINSLMEANLARTYMTLGKLARAEEILLSLPPERQHEGLAVLALFRGDEADFRKRLLAYSRARSTMFARLLLARSGFASEAEKGLSAQPGSNPGQWKVVRGQIALARGQTRQAIELLEAGIPLIRRWGEPGLFLASEALAEAWERQGDLAKAVQVLEAASREKERAVSNGYGAPQFWMRNQVRLAQLYRKSGRLEEAQAVEDELRKLMAVADADHVILAELRADSQAGVKPPRK